MHYFLQVVYTTMQAISFAVFNLGFIILYLMYWMYKNQEIEVQSVF